MELFWNGRRKEIHEKSFLGCKIEQRLKFIKHKIKPQQIKLVNKWFEIENDWDGVKKCILRTGKQM